MYKPDPNIVAKEAQAQDHLEELRQMFVENQGEAPLSDLPEQYEIIGKVSQGGMGWIYKAINKYTNNEVAIKILRPEYAQDAIAVQRFIGEAKAASALRHPNICQVYDFGITESKVAYLVMDWINGISLTAKVDRDKRLPAAEATLIFQQVADALAFAHRMKVVHRDLKPDNIMLSRDTEGKSVVYIVDFGIAKVMDEDLHATNLTQTGIVVGTPTYMSPEQARGEEIDGRADIYSLGCVMFFALVGRPPFLGVTVIDTITKHLTEPVPPIDPALKVPQGLKMIMLSAMEKERCDRYQSMNQVGNDLRNLTRGADIEHRTLSTDRKAAQKKRITIISFVAGFAIMYALSVGIQSLFDRLPPPSHGDAGKTTHPAK